MWKELAAFYSRPTARNYRAARRLVLALADRNGGWLPWPQWEPLAAGGRWPALQQQLDDWLPRAALSPRFHYLMACAAAGLGAADLAEESRFACEACLDGILATGDGTESRPWLVTYGQDERDVLAALRREPLNQCLVRKRSRQLDVLTCRDGGAAWFDVTELVYAAAKTPRPRFRRPSTPARATRRTAVPAGRRAEE